MLSAVHTCELGSSIENLTDGEYNSCVPVPTTKLLAEVMFTLAPRDNCRDDPMINLNVALKEENIAKCQILRGLFFSDEHSCSSTTIKSCRVVNWNALLPNCEIQCRCAGGNCTVSFVMRPKFQNNFYHQIQICEIRHSHH